MDAFNFEAFAFGEIHKPAPWTAIEWQRSRLRYPAFFESRDRLFDALRFRFASTSTASKVAIAIMP